MAIVEGKRPSLVKPSINTPFHVDFEWWKKNERDWHVYLRTLLCPEHQEAFANIEEGQTIDWVDPMTAEVKPVEGVQNTLMMHCVKQPDSSRTRLHWSRPCFAYFLPTGTCPCPPGTWVRN